MADNNAAAAAALMGGAGGEEESQENLVAKFQTLSAEGDLLAQKGAYTAAIDSFSRALEIKNNTDAHCLVARSKCYIYIGSPDLALEDANTCLKLDPSNFKAVFQKAEALYAKGDFEMALMYYHRGSRLRPELSKFRIGIQKSREAIENSIGNPKDFKIPVPSHLRHHNLLSNQPSSESANDTRTSGNANASTSKNPANGLNSMTPGMESKLLGELYDDKCYLQNLISDRDFVEHPDEDIKSLVNEGLRYLNTRVEFWRQQHPLYSRPKPVKIKPVSSVSKKGKEKQVAVPPPPSLQKSAAPLKASAGSQAPRSAIRESVMKGGDKRTPSATLSTKPPSAIPPLHKPSIST